MKLYQSYIGPVQRMLVSPNAIAFDAQHNTGRDQREYELLKSIRLSQGEGQPEPWGLVSWKFEHKTLITVSDFTKFCARQFAAGADCVFVNPMVGNEAVFFNVWEQGVGVGHAGMDQIVTFLQSRIGPSMMNLMGRASFACNNYMVATDAFWSAYFAFVDHGLAALEIEAANQTPVGLIYAGSAHYARDPTVTMRPFIVERLLSTFLVHPSCQFRCAYYPFGQEHYQRKFGVQLGRLLHKLSMTKNRALADRNGEALQKWHRLRGSILSDAYLYAILHLDDPAAFYLNPEFREFLAD